MTASATGILAVTLPFGTETREAALAGVAEGCPDAREGGLAARGAELLARYFSGERVDLRLPWEVAGASSFRRRVLEVVAAIPYGETLTYREVAARAGSPAGARGVGGVMARNAIPLIIPCHRVVGSTGKLTGFTAPGGLVAKEYLLRLEGALS